MQFYSVAKTLAEQAAIEYGLNSEMEVVTIGPSIVAGPCVTSTFPFTCQFILGPITEPGLLFFLNSCTDCLLFIRA